MVARHDGRVVFVADAIPGERVIARVTDSRHDAFWRADAVRVVEPSPHRREHVWAEASIERDPDDRAGGAEFGHIDLDHQRTLKTEVLRDALHRFADLDSDVVVEPIGADEVRDGRAWRTRVDLHVDREGRVGPFSARSHRVVPVDDLPLAVDEIALAAPLGARAEGARTLRLVAPSAGPVRLLVDDQEVDAEGFDVDDEPDPVVERVGGREFRLDLAGFWQVHRDAAEALSQAVRAAATSGDRTPDARAVHLDLYGGVGLFAAALADLVGPDARLETVESDARATSWARENLADLGDITATTARVEDRLRAIADDPASRRAFADGTVVLDPPRAGAGRAVVEALDAVDPARIVYVACDPVALARDLGTFAGLGWAPGPVRALDLFPHTHHVEAVVALDRSVR